MEDAKKENSRQPYDRPTLKKWGTAFDLTAVGPGVGGDVMEGSVLEEGCGGGSATAGPSSACTVSF